MILIPTIITSLISIIAIWVIRKNRIETNRPILTILLDSSQGGNISTPLSIKIYNTGNTPALNITLDANVKDIQKSFSNTGNKDFKEDILLCLSKKNIIPVIHNGQYVYNAFGLLSNNSDNIFILNSKISIVIEYSDIYENKYSQKQILTIKLTDTFANIEWANSKEK